MSRKEGFGWDGVSRPADEEYEKKVANIFRKCKGCGKLHNHCTCEKEEKEDE